MEMHMTWIPKSNFPKKVENAEFWREIKVIVVYWIQQGQTDQRQIAGIWSLVASCLKTKQNTKIIIGSGEIFLEFNSQTKVRQLVCLDWLGETFSICWITLHQVKFFRSAIAKKKKKDMVK